MSYSFDYVNTLINVSAGQTAVDCQSLYSAIVAEQATERGMSYGTIATATGLDYLGFGVQVGITVTLLGTWQLKFPQGNYAPTISGGNLIGGLNGDPIAYTPGVNVRLIYSAASTVVTSNGIASGGLTPTQAAQLSSIQNNTNLIPALL